MKYLCDFAHKWYTSMYLNACMNYLCNFAHKWYASILFRNNAIYLKVYFKDLSVEYLEQLPLYNSIGDIFG